VERRRLLLASLSALACGAGLAPVVAAERLLSTPQIRTLERRLGGRLGVAVLDSASGDTFAYRGPERFPMCSTFKLSAVAAVLKRVDEGRERMDRFIAFGREDLLEYAPIARANLAAGGMQIRELCDAAIRYSDNTAANLLLAQIGGPEGLTRDLRAWGDTETRLDRTEPLLNEATPGDVRDTTTPLAMLGTLNRILLGNVLLEPSRQFLTGWLCRNTTGNAKLRAGLPLPWTVGDKTGSGRHGASGDLAIAWPPGAKPMLLVVYMVESKLTGHSQDAGFAEIGRDVAQRYQMGR
jgi:beta-lactamase class A